MTNNDLNLLLAILGIAISLLGIFTTILIAAFGAIAGLIVAAYIAGSVITATLMWRFQRRAPP
jgi:hypothetical protein